VYRIENALKIDFILVTVTEKSFYRLGILFRFVHVPFSLSIWTQNPVYLFYPDSGAQDFANQ
jgi:hypothetical protein